MKSNFIYIFITYCFIQSYLSSYPKTWIETMTHLVSYTCKFYYEVINDIVNNISIVNGRNIDSIKNQYRTPLLITICLLNFVNRSIIHSGITYILFYCEYNKGCRYIIIEICSLKKIFLSSMSCSSCEISFD